MKKIIVLVLVLLFMPVFAFADDIADVKAFFNKYVNAANTYSTDIPSYYSPNAKIVRVIMKKDGTTKTMTTNMAEYTKQLKLNAKIAKVRNYKNFYSDISVAKVGSNYKLTCKRKPSLSDYKLPASFVITKNASGQYKIIQESMHTKVQTFLLYADKSET